MTRRNILQDNTVADLLILHQLVAEGTPKVLESGNKMRQVSSAYKLFREEQLKVYDDNASIKESKQELKGGVFRY